MTDSPVIDLSLRAPRKIIADWGVMRGVVLVAWFRLVRPACVGTMWAVITLYAYRYLLPFDQGDLSWPELISYVAIIGTMGAALTTWMILAHVAHPFTSKSRMQRLLRRKPRVTVAQPALFADTASRDWDPEARVFVASHDASGMIAALRPQPIPVASSDDDDAKVPASAEPAYRARVAYKMGTPRE
ncbi:Biofilm PGA synthesis auxiliary protein PgaD [Burkholderia sp. 22PA0099]|uniref:Biofilm PGA synthesis auxiliary protein PgaD n=1 Tax=Burkholderia sp. 22PA0099 TaxID=3237372 RepID=UPI0039C3463C